LTIEYIEVNDIGNDLKIKYLPDKYWYNLEQSNNILLVANKSMRQIKNYKILVDLFKTNDFKPINKYDSRMNIFDNSINAILSEMNLDEVEVEVYNYSTLFDSKDLCFKYYRFILNYLEYY